MYGSRLCLIAIHQQWSLEQYLWSNSLEWKYIRSCDCWSSYKQLSLVLEKLARITPFESDNILSMISVHISFYIEEAAKLKFGSAWMISPCFFLFWFAMGTQWLWPLVSKISEVKINRRLNNIVVCPNVQYNCIAD